MNRSSCLAVLSLLAQTSVAVVVHVPRYSPQDQYDYMVQMCDHRIVDVAGTYESLDCPLDQLNPRQQAKYLAHASRRFLQSIPQAFLNLPGRDTNREIDEIMEWNAADMASIIRSMIPYDEFWLSPGLYIDPETHARACFLYKRSVDEDDKENDRLPKNFLVAGGHYWRISPEDLRERRISIGYDFYSNMIMMDVTPQRIHAAPPGCLIWSQSGESGAAMSVTRIVDYRPQVVTCDTLYFIGCAKSGDIESASALRVLFTDTDARDDAVVVTADDGVEERDNPEYDSGGRSSGIAPDGGGLLGGYRLLLRIAGTDGADVEDGLRDLVASESHGTAYDRCYLLFQCQLSAGVIRWCGKYPAYQAAHDAGRRACSMAVDPAGAILVEVPEPCPARPTSGRLESALSKKLQPIDEDSLSLERLKLCFPASCFLD